MKRYLLADVLSFLEVVCAIAIGVGIYCGFTPETVLTLFGIGELCDAFDGAAARKWPYPNDGKRRPWRNPTFIKHYEWAKDIFLGLITLAFIAVRIDFWTGVVCGGLALAMGLWMQGYAGSLWVHAHTRHQNDEERAHNLRELEEFYVKRRIYTYVPAIATLVLILLFSTAWFMLFKALIVFALVMMAIMLWSFKEDRRTSEDPEKLPRPSRAYMFILKRLMDERLFEDLEA